MVVAMSCMINKNYISVLLSLCISNIYQFYLIPYNIWNDSQCLYNELTFSYLQYIWICGYHLWQSKVYQMIYGRHLSILYHYLGIIGKSVSTLLLYIYLFLLINIVGTIKRKKFPSRLVEFQNYNGPKRI